MNATQSCLSEQASSLRAAPDALQDAVRQPQRLTDFFGRPRATLDWGKAALVLIDHQQEYVDGALPLSGMESAVEAAQRLLAVARRHGAPVIHVVHVTPAGAPAFDPARPQAAIIEALSPLADEQVVTKTKPSSFALTDLHARLQALDCKQLVVAGFATHMCVSTTVRAATELGYACFTVAPACASRDLPGIDGHVVPAAVVHATALAELADNFGQVLNYVPD